MAIPLRRQADQGRVNALGDAFEVAVGIGWPEESHAARERRLQDLSARQRRLEQAPLVVRR